MDVSAVLLPGCKKGEDKGPGQCWRLLMLGGYCRYGGLEIREREEKTSAKQSREECYSSFFVVLGLH